MSKQAPVTRRRILVAGSITLAGGATLLALNSLPSGTASIFDSEAARNIGHKFAGIYPDHEALWRDSPPDSRDQWGERLAEMMRDDLEADRTIQVEGWWLTETEVRFCVYIYSLNA